MSIDSDGKPKCRLGVGFLQVEKSYTDEVKRQELNFTSWKIIFCIQPILSRDWKFFTFSTISGGYAALEEDLARNDWAEVYQQQVSPEFPPL